MPLYDYECRNCGNVVEVLHGVNDSGPAACAVCGGQMRKLINQPAIVFKGSGWAKKDARDAKPAAKSGSKVSTESDSSKSTDSGAGGDSGDGSKSDGASKSSDGGRKSTDSRSTDSAGEKPASKGTSAATASD